MGELDRPGHPGQERNAGADGEAVLVAVPGDLAAFDELHRDVGPSVVGGSPVIETGNTRVPEPGEDRPLPAKAPARVRVLAALAQELDRDPLPGRPGIGRLGNVDHAHAAAPDPLEQAVGADQLPAPFLVHRTRQGGGQDGRLLEPGRLRPVQGQKLLDRGQQLLVPRAQPSDEGQPLLRGPRVVESRLEDALGSTPQPKGERVHGDLVPGGSDAVGK